MEAIRLDENSIDARRTLGWLYLYQKKLDLSKTEFEKAMSINPGDAFVMAN